MIDDCGFGRADMPGFFLIFCAHFKPETTL
jgi:hypothetical protein